MRNFLFLIFFAFLFVFAGGLLDNVQAALNDNCDTNSDCAGYACRGDLKPGDLEKKGRCVGPCTKNDDCNAFINQAPVNWEAAKCLGDAGKPANCIELPAKQLPKGPQTGKELLELVKAITDWIFAIFLLTAVIFIILAAFQFLTGGGDPGKLAEARNKLIYAAVAIAVALLARGIPVVVKNIVGV
ncbi:MAG: hypothetical protein AAB567_02085 [Patescibacteria group bacterium]